MSHHHYDDCSYSYSAMPGSYPTMPAYSGYGTMGYSGGPGGIAGYGSYGGIAGVGGYGVGYARGFAGWGIRWIYALLLLIVIVLQFGRNYPRYCNIPSSCCDDGADADTAYYGNGLYNPYGNQLIDNSVLFIIVVFLLVICGGCWWGGGAW